MSTDPVSTDPVSTDPVSTAAASTVAASTVAASTVAGTGDAAKTFEQLLAELEEVTDRLAGGELGIEAATDLYEQAERLHALASARLAQVQERVDRLRAEAAPPAP